MVYSCRNVPSYSSYYLFFFLIGGIICPGFGVSTDSTAVRDFEGLKRTIFTVCVYVLGRHFGIMLS